MLVSRLFVLSCGLISIGHGLSLTCFGRVLKGLLVYGTAKRITLPLELFAMTIGLILGQLTVLGDSWPGKYA